MQGGACRTRSFAAIVHLGGREGTLPPLSRPMQAPCARGGADIHRNRPARRPTAGTPPPPSQDYGLAVEFCDKVLALDPDNARARLRRAKANVGRHQYGLADADLADADRASGGWPAAGVEEVRAALARARREGAASERNSFGRMFAQKA